MSQVWKFIYKTTIAPFFILTTVGCISDSPDADGADERELDGLLAEARHDDAPTRAKLRIPLTDLGLIKGTYIVRLAENAVQQDDPGKVMVAERRRRLAEGMVARVGLPKAALRHVYESALNGFAADMTEAEALQLADDPAVEFVEQDQVMQTTLAWGIDRIDQRSLPLDDVYTPGHADGRDVHTYVIDTGIRATHNELAGRVGPGRDLVDGDDTPVDCHGHGTHVAASLAGKTHGVAPGATIHGVRVLNCNGSGSNADVIAGIDWVRLNHVKPAVANLSLGGGVSQALDDAVASAISAGVTFAISAGNDNKSACDSSPARTPSAITVGSTTNTDGRSSFSNLGQCLDIFAPGTNIVSAWYTSNTATKTLSGTSMASPHVAGAAARYLSSHPSASPQEVRDALVQAATVDKITGAGTGSPNRLLYVGIETAGPPPSPSPSPSGSLRSGVPLTGLSAPVGAWIHHTFPVPAGAARVRFQMSGGVGDADLYVKRGAQPTVTSYDCRPYLLGNVETCTSNNPAEGMYHVSIRAYGAFSGVSLAANLE
ncbi:S8 family peptidase [Chondromyces crocatus]|uniref:Serine protease n=1 Tax=Chondromyces crocatus TaxID=52 RepID=A0A0K1ECM1_CHOCO|nr:S8 family peptidase [Chondromyces crocatus]AKT38447.1 uncharacterized protein CMC5_025930 [Chondromyces crocatus]